MHYCDTAAPGFELSTPRAWRIDLDELLRFLEPSPASATESGSGWPNLPVSGLV